MKTNRVLPKPEWVRGLAPEDEFILYLDEYLENGVEPLPVVLRLADEMRPCQCLHLIAEHDPTLLLKIMEEKGMEHYVEANPGVWDLYFRRKVCACA